MLPKHMLACRRPDELDVRIAPLVATPGHSAYPSAHATQAFAMADVLAALARSVPGHYPDLEKRVDLMFRQAHRIAANRTVAGVHFPMDSIAGARLGIQIGRGMVGLMTGTMAPTAVAALDPNADPTKDFLFADLVPDLPPATGGGTAQRDPLFGWIWDQARAEFAFARRGLDHGPAAHVTGLGAVANRLGPYEQWMFDIGKVFDLPDLMLQDAPTFPPWQSFRTP